MHFITKKYIYKVYIRVIYLFYIAFEYKIHDIVVNF